MKSFLLKIWKDPVGSNVISGIIILGITSLGAWLWGTFLLGEWQWGILPQAKAVLQFIFSLFTLSIPVWVIILVLTLGIGINRAIGLLLSESKPQFLTYRSDHILGVDWYWEYSEPGFYNDKYTPTNLTPRCPKCNSALDKYGSGHSVISCINDECRFDWSNAVGYRQDIYGFDTLEDKVRNVIDRKVHNDEYHNAGPAFKRST